MRQEFAAAAMAEVLPILLEIRILHRSLAK